MEQITNKERLVKLIISAIINEIVAPPTTINALKDEGIIAIVTTVEFDWSTSLYPMHLQQKLEIL